MKRVIARLLLTVIAVISLTACNHKELCLHHDHLVTLRLEFDWRDAPEANPAGMCVYFYPLDGSAHRVFQFDNIVGGEISLPEGEYLALCYNNDTPGVNFDDIHRYDRHYAFTRDGSLLEPLGVYRSYSNKEIPRAPQAEEERVVICPDQLWGCKAVDIKVTEQGVSYECNPFDPDDDEDPDNSSTRLDQVIILYPHELTCIYTYEIRNVENIDRISKMCASLSGMAPTLTIFNEELGRECVTLPFDAVARPSVNKITGRFITFGHHEENEQPHRMMLYVWTKDGNAYSFGTSSERFDLTDQVHAAPNRRRVHLIIDGLSIPKPQDPDTGNMMPDVDDWGEIKIDINM